MIGTIGNPTIIRKTDLPFAVKNVAIFKVGGDRTKSRFLFELLQSDCVQRKMTLDQVGNAQKFVGLGYLRGFQIYLPSEKELRVIESVSNSIDRVIFERMTAASSMRNLKAAVMQDLLTGKVRVKVN